MDSLLHLLVNFALTKDIFIAIGGLLPDIIYFATTAVYLTSILIDKLKNPDKGNNESEHASRLLKTRHTELKQRYSPIWRWGERMHSFFILPLVLLLAGLFNAVFILLLIGTILHISFDIISHKTYGPRYFWPLKDDPISMGIIQWEEHLSLTVFSWILVITIIGFRLVMEI
ncbi:MAG: hypothetical protein ACFFD4_31450 [Candidatus Odinarchaeota archaeon]